MFFKFFARMLISFFSTSLTRPIALTAGAICTVMSSLAGIDGVAAQEVDGATTGLRIELNTQQSDEAECLLTFVSVNRSAVEISEYSYEVVIFDQDQLVNTFSVLDFLDLPANSTRVRQFESSGSSCENISSILFNGSVSCNTSANNEAFCIEELELYSRTSIELLG